MQDAGTRSLPQGPLQSDHLESIPTVYRRPADSDETRVVLFAVSVWRGRLAREASASQPDAFSNPFRTTSAVSRTSFKTPTSSWLNHRTSSASLPGCNSPDTLWQRKSIST